MFLLLPLTCLAIGSVIGFYLPWAALAVLTVILLAVSGAIFKGVSLVGAA